MKSEKVLTILISTAISLFIVNLLYGYLDYQNVITLAKTVFGEMEKEVIAQDIISKIKLMFIIFLRNLSVTGLMVVTGPFLSIISFLVISFNGYLIGGVFKYSLINRGLIRSIMLLLPHGVIEIPTFFYAAYISIKLSIQFIRDKETFVDNYREALYKILSRITPLLLVAAFVESFITPYVASLV